MKNRVWLEISLKTLRENFGNIRSSVSPCGVIAVLKANAYGLGVREIAKTLADAGASGFGVAELNEALMLNDAGVPVQILGGVLPEEIPSAVREGIILAVTDAEIAKLISDEAVKQKRTAECQFLVDTGMGRLGILASEAFDIIKNAVTLPNINFSGIYSHFPMAYMTGSEYTLNQVTKFLKLLEQLKSSGIVFRKIHIANSDAINNFPVTYKLPFNFVRTGINLHGSFDSQGQHVLKLKSILTLKTRLVSVRNLPAGMSLGYGGTYTLPVNMKVGIISAGYADGLPLALSNRGYVIIRGKPCHVLGRISMDYTTVSLEQVQDAERGDEVTCLGGEGPLAITVESWAQLKGTHPYEIICSFGSRVNRICV
ncbi:MAG: alanine racemase [Lentisphaerae bacterium]|nr:alanine racemase [Lentisphaerota bacterium]